LFVGELSGKFIIIFISWLATGGRTVEWSEDIMIRTLGEELESSTERIKYPANLEGKRRGPR